jgi:hypothetical protein
MSKAIVCTNTSWSVVCVYVQNGKCTYTYIHFLTCIHTYIHGNTCKCKYVYVHGIYVYIHVYTFMYELSNAYTCIYHVHSCIYIPGPDSKILSRYIQLMFHVQTGTYIFLKCTYIFEPSTYTDVPFLFQLFGLPGWLACNQ